MGENIDGIFVSRVFWLGWLGHYDARVVCNGIVSWERPYTGRPGSRMA
jgi:hypothetical protein